MGATSSMMKATQGSTVAVITTIEGAGAANPEVEEGANEVTVTWQSTGVYRYTFKTKRAYYMGPTWGLRAATPANVIAHEAISDDLDTSGTSYFVDVTFSNGSVAHDLAADEHLTVIFWFRETSRTS